MTIKINDHVTFKEGGTEVYGKVTLVMGTTAIIKVWDSLLGEFYETRQPFSRCSKD